MRLVIYVATLFLLCFCGTTATAAAQPKHLFKVASLAPDGSVWVTAFKNFAQEVSDKTGGDVGFRVYTGGVMGDDMAMYRKMRVGQLHGGGFTMTGISSIVPDFRVASLPFLFKSYGEVDAVMSGLLPDFSKQFADKGMELIALTEVGFIYTMSTKPIMTTTELQKATCWMPSGDPLAESFFDSIDITPVQLSIPDVLSSLQTGLIDTVYNSLYGSIVLQWFTKARYITDTPFGYAYGVFLLDRKKFSKLTAEQAEIVKSAAARHFSILLAETRKSNDESRQVLEKQGVKFVNADPESLRELEAYRDESTKELIDKAFSLEIYEQTEKLLQTFRREQPQK